MAGIRAFSFLVSLAAAGHCLAHAVVVDSVPANGALLRESPKQVELRFNVRVEQALARASLRDATRDPVTLTPLRSSAARSERLVIPLPSLGAGSYELRYHVLAVDGHATQGVLRFRVLP